MTQVTKIETHSSCILLLSHDKVLAQTRQWLLEQAKFCMTTVHTLKDLEDVASRRTITLFLLCNSLPAELRSEAITRIHTQWPRAKVLVFVPFYPLPELPADEFFPAMEGPDKLIRTIRTLTPHGSAALN